MQSAWKHVKKDEAPDGPARVVKPGDWGAVPDGSLKDFPLIAFNMPGRVAPKPDSNEKKLAEMAKEARKEDDLHKQALKKLQQEKEGAALAALAQGREEGQRLGEQQATEKFSQAFVNKTLDHFQLYRMTTHISRLARKSKKPS